MMRKQVLLLFLMISSVIFSQKNLTAEDFFVIKDSVEEAVILDVRSYEEFSEERISGALFGGEKELLFNIVSDYDKERPIFIYCSYGHRSRAVVEILMKEGFSNLYTLKNGINDWKEKGFPIDYSEID